MTTYLVVDVHCEPCRRPGKLGPRLARFVRADGGGPVGVQPFTVGGQRVIPYCHVRKDGGRTWYLACRCGHERRLPEEQVSAALDTVDPTVRNRRVSL